MFAPEGLGQPFLKHFDGAILQIFNAIDAITNFAHKINSISRLEEVFPQTHDARRRAANANHIQENPRHELVQKNGFGQIQEAPT
jgi:hypothetical protein